MKIPDCTFFATAEAESRRIEQRISYKPKMPRKHAWQGFPRSVGSRNAFKSFSVLVSVSGSWAGRKIFQLRAWCLEVPTAALQGVLK